MSYEYKIEKILGTTFSTSVCEEHYETHKKWEYVSREEYIKFIKEYPNRLYRDFYMDWYSYNDFSNGKVWPESMVAMEYHMYDIDEYKIWRGEYETLLIPKK